jgi:hypothetical protein
VTDDLSTWERAQLDDDERVARATTALSSGTWRIDARGEMRDSDGVGVIHASARIAPADLDHIARHDPLRALARVAADRRILDEHASEWRTVEWPHDQNGKGEGLVCRRCQNAEYTEWHPAVGEAGVLPEGFVAPYILAPCRTVRLLALHHAARPGYRDEWRP